MNKHPTQKVRERKNNKIKENGKKKLTKRKVQIKELENISIERINK